MTEPDQRKLQNCVECESDYVAESSRMEELCPECAHHLYGYPCCEHVFAGQRCVKCGWDGSRSRYLRTRIDGEEE